MLTAGLSGLGQLPAIRRYVYFSRNVKPAPVADALIQIKPTCCAFLALLADLGGVLAFAAHAAYQTQIVQTQIVPNRRFPTVTPGEQLVLFLQDTSVFGKPFLSDK